LGWAERGEEGVVSEFAILFATPGGVFGVCVENQFMHDLTDGFEMGSDDISHLEGEFLLAGGMGFDGEGLWVDCEDEDWSGFGVLCYLVHFQLFFYARYEGSTLVLLHYELYD
jgi:hypothetical protein